jgi:phage virion morphogenesis protein
MAGILLHLDDRGLQRALAGIRAALRDLSPVMADIGEAVVSQTQDSFENQAGPDGTPWQPSQRAEREGGQTLIDSGQLFGSIGYDALPESVIIGSNRVYAAIHQFGGKTGRGGSVKLAARPYLPDESTIDWSAVTKAIQSHLLGGIQ